MLEHAEAVDLDLEQLTRALDQRAIRLERGDELENAAHVLDAGLAQPLQRVLGDHGADAIVGEQLQQQGAIDVPRKQVNAPHRRAAGFDGGWQIQAGVLRQVLPRGRAACASETRQLALQRAVRSCDPRLFGQEHQLVGRQRNRGLGRHVLHREVEDLPGRRISERRQQHELSGIQPIAIASAWMLPHFPGVLHVHAVHHASRAAR